MPPALGLLALFSILLLGEGPVSQGQEPGGSEIESLRKKVEALEKKMKKAPPVAREKLAKEIQKLKDRIAALEHKKPPADLRAEVKKLHRSSDKPTVLPRKGQGCFALFQADKTDHDLTNAYLLALASSMIYTGSLNVKNITDDAAFVPRYEKLFRRFGMRQFNFIRGKNGTELMVMSNDKLVIVCFRGSESGQAEEQFKDWILADFNALLEPKKQLGPGVMVHRGFWKALDSDSVYTRVVQAVKKQGGFQGKKVFVTGHSLGAALATLCAARMSKDGTGTPVAYTYGGPRVGNEAFRKAFRARQHRWINYNDVVPMVPPDLPLGYRHVGSTNNIKKDGSIKLDDREYRGPPSARAHHDFLYCAGLYNNLPPSVKGKMPEPPRD
jgi:hypothetical protein